MKEALKVFVGAKTNEKGGVCAADTDELLLMAKEAQEQGFVVACSLDHTHQMIKTQAAKVVEVHGATTGDCVAKTVGCAIEAGAQIVVVPLIECRYGTQDHARHNLHQREIGVRWIFKKGIRCPS